ncbi:MAG: DUF547 domain-containing protein [Planctomycetes bacterium]|nr:DUF547 domain-containing protein [Planctomycetota bacterium]
MRILLCTSILPFLAAPILACAGSATPPTAPERTASPAPAPTSGSPTAAPGRTSEGSPESSRPRTSAAPADEDPAPAPQPPFDALHAPWTAILAARVKGGDFDYAGLAAARAPLDSYVAALEAVQPGAFAALSRKEQFAFWINAYNAYTVKRVLDGWPVKSIRDLGDEKTSVWDREFVPLGRLVPALGKERLTLNDIEHKVLRPTFTDARLHAAVNCASRGCPALRAEAFVAEKLDVQLDEQVKAWLADTSRNRFDRAKGRVEISKVFEWFAEDFRREAGGVTAWIARFRPADREWLTAASQPEVRYLEYDWALNAARK